MRVSQCMMAAAFCMALAFSGQAYADDAKPADAAPAPAAAKAAPPHHHMMGKWRHGMMGCHRLSPEQNKMVQGAMMQAHKKNMALMDGAKKIHEKLKAAVSAENFNEKAFLSAQEEMSNLHAKMQRNKAEAFASIAGKLPAKERMCAGMMFMMPHRGGPGMRHGGPGMMHHHGMHGQGGWGHKGGWQHHEGWNRDGGDRPSNNNNGGGDFSHLND